MDRKIFAILAVMLMAIGGTAVLQESEESDATSYQYRLNNNTNCTVTPSGLQPAFTSSSAPVYILDSDGIKLNGETICTTTPASNYEVTGWSVSDGNNITTYSDLPYTLTSTKTYLAFAPIVTSTASAFTVTIQSNNTAYGTVSTSSVADVPSGSAITVSSNTLTVNGTTVTATPATATSDYTYSFSSWSVTSGTTVTSDMTITATFTRTAVVQAGYTASFTSQYGTGSQASITTGTDNILTLPAYGGFTYTGHTQTGWTFSYQAGGDLGTVFVTKEAGETYTLESDTTWTATWTANKHSVAFSAETGGTVDVPTVANVSYDATFTVSDNTITVNGTTITATASTGYEFSRWSVTNGQQVADTLSVMAYMTKVYKTVTVGVYGAGGTVSPSSSLFIPSGSQVTISGNTITIYGTTYTATASSGYLFSKWTIAGTTEISTGYTITTDNTDIAATFVRNTASVTVSITAGTGGTVDYSSVTGALTGQTITVSGNTLAINGTTVTATASTGYEFFAWSVASGTVITGNMTITATFMASGTTTGTVYWSNNLNNGVISIGMALGATTQGHRMTLSLNSYDGLNDDQTSIWESSGYTLEVSAAYASSATSVTAILKQGSTVKASGMASIGNWPQFIITLDLENSEVLVNGVKFSSDVDGINFQSYEPYNKTYSVLDYSSKLGSTTATTITHSDFGSGTHPLFTVISTEVFFDSYGIVLNNPSIDVAALFPNYSDLRLNFYGFAVLGTSMTINGTTYTLDSNGQVTVSYVTATSGDNVLPSVLPSQAVKTKTMSFSNLYVTWEGAHVSLTFADDRFTIDLGVYTAKTVSFAGVWWFTTELWEPGTKEVHELGDWKALPDITEDQYIVIFLGCLLIFGLIAHIAWKSQIVDLVIIGMAAIVAIIMLGV